MRRWILALLGVVAVEFFIAPFGGRVFDLVFPEERGLTGMIPDIPFYHWGYASIFALGFVLGIAFARWRAARARVPSAADAARITPDKSEHRTASMDVTEQKQLINELKEHAGSNVEISFASISYEPFAKTIKSIFDLAGWDTNMNNIPIEQYNPGVYIEGVEVRGFNKHLLDFVCDALEQNGLSVRRDLRTTEIKRNNPKWLWVQRNIKITIGHH